ncbi:tRNA dihydrouridine synthase DusB [Salinarimonas ramus]|uniref:tRNA-dihydrouridine synthase n=1 Tax=Salinarimonas ramus TaxID=690164 RepID=A0A917V215_9HYPH|nr:tRNA dihydrouridine synthase DusB [Salinarimonas ramus]GGK18057.1 tRNA-dihydrouridine synthase [Salinarimonas ramus]
MQQNRSPSDETRPDPTWRIGPVAIRRRAVLAPMSGVTDLHMRRIAAGFGAGLVVSEMVASDEFVKGDEETRVRAEGEGVSPHVVQLAGCDAHWMAEAARLAEANGADAVDINMGCPAKRVTGGWAGSALMRDLDHATGLIEATVAAVSIPVTVKMRLGWDDASCNAPELARRAEVAGAQAITVHGRTRQQFYKGNADWDAIRPVRAATTLPLVANGDIATLDDARVCLARSGADAVMIGRAATGRPWLVATIGAGLAGEYASEPSAEAKVSAMRAHYEGLLALYGARMAVRHARKHLAAFADHARADGFALPQAARARLVTSDDPAEVLALIGAVYTHPLRDAA